MSTKPTPENLRRLVAAINPRLTGYAESTCGRLRQAVKILLAGKVDTGNLSTALGYKPKASGFYEILAAGKYLGILDTHYHVGGKRTGSRPHAVRVVTTGLAALANRKAVAEGTEFDSLSQPRRKLIALCEPEEMGLTPQQWWHLARLIAAIGESDDRRLRLSQIGAMLLMAETTVCRLLRLAEKKGFVRSRGKGNWSGRYFVVIWDGVRKFATRKPPGWLPTPIRKPWALLSGEEINRLSGAEEKWLDRATPEDLGCQTERRAENARRLARLLGLRRVTSDRELAREFGTSKMTVRTACDDLKRVGRLKRERTYGRNGDDGDGSLFTLNLDPRNGNPARSTNGHAAASKPEWDKASGQLSFGDSQWSIAKQARRLREALDAFESAGWPQKINSTCVAGSQAHKDLVHGLKKCPFLEFSSTLSGSAIAWKTR